MSARPHLTIPDFEARQQIPNRAALARKFPRLRVNRLTWRWRDDASGRRGDDLESLRAFLKEARR